MRITLLFTCLLFPVLSYCQTNAYQQCRDAESKRYQAAKDNLWARYFRKLQEPAAGKARIAKDGDLCVAHNRIGCTMCATAYENGEQMLEITHNSNEMKCEQLANSIKNQLEQERERKRAELVRNDKSDLKKYLNEERKKEELAEAEAQKQNAERKWGFCYYIYEGTIKFLGDPQEAEEKKAEPTWVFYVSEVVDFSQFAGCNTSHTNAKINMVGNSTDRTLICAGDWFGKKMERRYGIKDAYKWVQISLDKNMNMRTRQEAEVARRKFMRIDPSMQGPPYNARAVSVY